ncbi:Ribosomal protein L24e family protein, partial [Prunus dulcis]
SNLGYPTLGLAGLGVTAGADFGREKKSNIFLPLGFSNDQESNGGSSAIALFLECPRLLVCCRRSVYPGHGIQFVRNDAKVKSKCHKNFKMKRNPRKVKWTKAYRRLRGKDMTQDSTFEFERKRNRPERYDRNLTENTLKAIKKIDKVRIIREERHHEKRMKGKKAKENREAVKELEQSISLVKAPTALQQDPSLTLPIKVKVSQQQPKKTVAMMEPNEDSMKFLLTLEPVKGSEKPSQGTIHHSITDKALPRFPPL